MEQLLKKLILPTSALCAVGLSGYILHGTYLTNQQNQQAVSQLLATKAITPATTIAAKSNNQTLNYTRGLMGQPLKPTQNLKQNSPKQAIQFGPKSLEGMFINGDQAWALVTNQTGEAIIIPPESIESFSSSGVMIQTKQGPKSLHLKRDISGIAIRKAQNSIKKTLRETHHKSEASKTFLDALTKNKKS